MLSTTLGEHRSIKRGSITEEIQKEARKVASPVVSDFLIAARRGFTEQVLLGLKEGGSAKALSQDKHGRNCLQLASIHGHFDTVHSILQTQMVNIDAVNKRGLTALHDASAEGHTRIALLLLAMGASIKTQTKDGWTCLMSACSNGHLQLAKIMVSVGCDVNIPTKLGLTSLHIAAWKGHADVVEMLLHEGCNPLSVSHNGKTALQLAQEENHHQSATILMAATSKISEDSVYRISSLEGQLRLNQTTLSKVHRSYEFELSKLQLKYEEKLATLQKEHEDMMNEAQKKIDSLTEKIQITLTNSTPSLSEQTPPSLLPKSPSSRKKRNSTTTAHGNSNYEHLKPQPSYNSNTATIKMLDCNDRLKSASYNDLVSNKQDGSSSRTTDLTKTPQLAPRRRSEKMDSLRRDSLDHLTITALVAESLSNPGSIATIRKELKSDSFTPKIQRKFHTPSSGATLTTLSSIGTKGNPKQEEKASLPKQVFDKRKNSQQQT